MIRHFRLGFCGCLQSLSTAPKPTNRLSQTKDELTQKIKEMSDKNQKKREELDKLDEALDKFIQQAQAMEEQLGIRLEVVDGSGTAKNLPGPLYTILRMAEGYSTAFPGTLSVVVRPENPQNSKEEDRGRHSGEEQADADAEFYRTASSCVVLTFLNPTVGVPVTATLHYLSKVGLLALYPVTGHRAHSRQPR